jgi:CheY-like chemotaxis protein
MSNVRHEFATTPPRANLENPPDDRPELSRPLTPRYGCAVVAFAVLVRLLLEPLLGNQFPFPTLLFAVLLTAWYRGSRPALAAVILGAVAVDYFLIPPLMDVHMPGMNGIEATRKIKADPRGKETVIVTLTASAMDDDRRAAAEGGADEFLAKPLREDELLDKTGALLNVLYEYEETNAGQPVAEAAALSADRLGQLPREVMEDLLDATMTGNKSLLDTLIGKVRAAADAASARALQELADRYEYDALTRLLEETCSL